MGVDACSSEFVINTLKIESADITILQQLFSAKSFAFPKRFAHR
jgi:hypothetical protein